MQNKLLSISQRSPQVSLVEVAISSQMERDNEFAMNGLFKNNIFQNMSILALEGKSTIVTYPEDEQIDFYSMSTHLELFHAKQLGNCIH